MSAATTRQQMPSWASNSRRRGEADASIRVDMALTAVYLRPATHLLAVIGMIDQDTMRSIKLLQQDDPNQWMWQGQI